MRIKRATFRHIEAEIYSYNDTLRAIQDMRDDIMHSTPRQEARVAGGSFTSIVERRATALADSLLLREMERITGTIADVYSRAKQLGREVVWLKYGLAIDWQPSTELMERVGSRYREDLSAGDMAWLLGVDDSTFHRYRTGFVYGIAEKLGWW